MEEEEGWRRRGPLRHCTHVRRDGEGERGMRREEMERQGEEILLPSA
jgi:hypothetical protein